MVEQGAFSVRPARRGDVPRVVGILLASFGPELDVAFGGGIGRAGPVLRRVLAWELERGHDGLLLAVAGDTVVGTLRLRRDQSVLRLAPLTRAFFTELGFLRGVRCLLELGLHYTPARRGDAYVEWLAVDPTWRRMGAGRALLAAASAWAEAHDMERLTLHVRGSNLRARRLYLSAGFSEVSPARPRVLRELLREGPGYLMACEVQLTSGAPASRDAAPPLPPAGRFPSAR